MTVLIEVRTPHGTTRRCDATCYKAQGDECNCVCGGRFHGKGLAAEEAPWEELDAVRQRIALDHGQTIQLRLGA